MSGWTLGFQVINFLVLAGVLRRFLFKPVTAMIAKRQDDLARAAEAGGRARHEALELRAQADTALAQIDTERARRLTETTSLIAEERERALAEARRDVETLRAAARKDIDDERERAARILASQAVELGAAIAGRLLQQVVAPSIAEAFLTRLCAYLDTASPGRLDELARDLKGGELLLATAPPLEPPDADRWVSRIAARLGNETRPRLVEDASLIAGAELRFPSTTLSYCWRDGLDAAREELAHDAGPR